jgi:uncharacterized protein
MKPYVSALQRGGLDAQAIDLPRSNAERAVPVFAQKVPAGSVAGGHSYGGRVASMTAVQVPYAALILLSYPLHRPGHPDDLRIEHWPKISCPVLLLSGDRDPFARIDLLRASIKRLKKAELVVYPGVGHGLLSVADDAMKQAVAFLRALRGTR